MKTKLLIIVAFIMTLVVATSCISNATPEQKHRFFELTEIASERPLTKEELMEYRQLVKDIKDEGVDWTKLLGYLGTAIGAIFGVNFLRGPIEPKEMRIQRLTEARVSSNKDN